MTQDQKITSYFQQTLSAHKQEIDAEIKMYSKRLEKTTLQKFGANSRMATDAYLSILARGGKRIRGSLVITGYEMVGGADRKMILRAAMAVEMLHAYILIIDDINDRSPSRRGGPTAHQAIKQLHEKKNWSDDSLHFGESIAMNAALTGNHAAQMMLANLSVDPALLTRAISVLNYGLITTAHGQFNDMFNEVTGEVDERDVLRVMEWKTAHYTFLNPLTFGMVLAGAGCGPTDAIAEYAIHAGIAFQITDDIMGTFGEEFESGKSSLDDIREGKRTLLTTYALAHATKADKNFLLQMLGNRTLTPDQFNRCREVLVDTGALAYAQEQARQKIEDAIRSLKKNKTFWAPQGQRYLEGLAQFLLTRKA